MREDMHHTFPETIQIRICYTGTRLDTKFNNIKYPAKNSHQHSVAYYDVSCPEPDCVEDYPGEEDRGLNERDLMRES